MSGSKIDMKIVLLGKEYGGKTSLVERYIYDRFSGAGGVPYQAVSFITKIVFISRIFLNTTKSKQINQP